MLHIPIVADSEEGFSQEFVDRLVGPTENASVIRIGGNAPDAEEDQRFQGTDILLRFPELLHIVVVVPPAGGSAR